MGVIHRTSVAELVLSDQGQMFAGVATIRAAIFDVIDGLRPAVSDAPYPVFDSWVFSCDGSEGDTEIRAHFVDLVVKRIAELQAAPHDGIKLENLCPRHVKRALPRPTVTCCVQCKKEGQDLA